MIIIVIIILYVVYDTWLGVTVHIVIRSRPVIVCCILIYMFVGQLELVTDMCGELWSGSAHRLEASSDV
jgi:hypothetical protein